MYLDLKSILATLVPVLMMYGFFLSGPGITGPYSNNSKNLALVPACPVAIILVLELPNHQLLLHTPGCGAFNATNNTCM